MRWQDWLATLLVILSAGLQSALSATANVAPLLNFPMITIALLSTYPRVHVFVLTGAVVLTRIAIGTESIPITIFRSVLSTLLSIKAGLSLMNHGWLLAVITVSACILIDLVAAIIAHPKYVGTLTITDIAVSVVFNAVITLLCAIPLEIYYRRRHIHGF
jgi:hypothetical protein